MSILKKSSTYGLPSYTLLLSMVIHVSYMSNLIWYPFFRNFSRYTVQNKSFPQIYHIPSSLIYDISAVWIRTAADIYKTVYHITKFPTQRGHQNPLEVAQSNVHVIIVTARNIHVWYMREIYSLYLTSKITIYAFLQNWNIVFSEVMY